MNSQTEEVRVKDPTTGGEKGSKLARYDLLPVLPLRELAEHYGRGAKKYADRNWEKGYKWSLSFAALCRHLFAWWGGEDIDAETGASHMTAVAWHAFALREFQARGLGTDDRARGPAPRLECPDCCHTAVGSCARCTPVNATDQTVCARCLQATCAGGCNPDRIVPYFCGKCDAVHDTAGECWDDFPAAEPPAMSEHDLILCPNCRVVTMVPGGTCIACGGKA